MTTIATGISDTDIGTISIEGIRKLRKPPHTLMETIVSGICKTRTGIFGTAAAIATGISDTDIGTISIGETGMRPRRVYALTETISIGIWDVMILNVKPIAKL